MDVKEHTQSDSPAANENMLLLEALATMGNHNLQSLPVIQGDRLVGRVSRDMMRTVARNSRMPIVTQLDALALLCQAKVGDVMESDSIVRDSDVPNEAPVLEQNTAVGIASIAETRRGPDASPSTHVPEATANSMRIIRQRQGSHTPEGTPQSVLAEWVFNVIANKESPTSGTGHLAGENVKEYFCILPLDGNEASALARELNLRGYVVETEAHIADGHESGAGKAGAKSAG
jgi:hypothetical protein